MKDGFLLLIVKNCFKNYFSICSVLTYGIFNEILKLSIFYSFELFQLRVTNTLKVNSKIACENHSFHKLKILLTNDFWHPKESAVFRWRERLAKIPFFNFSSFLFITIYHDKNCCSCENRMSSSSVRTLSSETTARSS